VPLDENCQERHHIIPRSLGGTNDFDNLVIVTAREHYILHMLLPKFITDKKDKEKMICAYNYMCNIKKTRINARLYERNKIMFCDIVSEQFKLLWQTEDFRDKMKNRRLWTQTEDFRLWIKNNTPLKNKEVHKKTIKNRTQNGTNVYVTNNPMWDPEKVRKKVAKTSGKHHYLVKGIKYRYSNDDGKTWIDIEDELTVRDICEKHGWSVGTFNVILKGKTISRGSMMNIKIERIYNENQKNREN
jgi:hypothetical protein